MQTNNIEKKIFFLFEGREGFKKKKKKKKKERKKNAVTLGQNHFRFGFELRCFLASALDKRRMFSQLMANTKQKQKQNKTKKKKRKMGKKKKK